jgi:uncharacterized membrane protein
LLSCEKEGLPSRLSEIIHHSLSPFTKRAFYAIVVLAIVMAVGIFGLMLIEGWDLVASFYFMALLATAEGPAATPATDVGKIFAAIMAFFSIGAAISAITFTFGPLFGSVLKEGVHYFEKEEERVKDKLEHTNSDPKTHSC